MILTAICASCSMVRASTGDVPRGTRVPASEFVPVPGQAQPVDGQPALCSTCGAQLAFRWLPAPGENGAAHVQGDTSLPIIAQQVTSEPTVEVLFETEAGEEVKIARELADGRIFVVTSRRIFRVSPGGKA